MKQIVCTMLIAISPGMAWADCPEFHERTSDLLALFAEVRDASNPATAQPITNRMWEIWATAPDETAQEILDRGLRRRASRDFLGATEDFDALIAYCPTYAEGYNQRAFVRFILQDFDGALTDLERAIELSPNHLAAQAGRALTLLGLGREEEGQAALRTALEIHPWLPERRLLKALEDKEETL